MSKEHEVNNTLYEEIRKLREAIALLELNVIPLGALCGKCMDKILQQRKREKEKNEQPNDRVK